jgi:hypothetical protein
MLMTTAVLTTACHEDLMDLKPYDSLSSSSMWNSENMADLGVTGVYNILRQSNVGVGTYWLDQYAVSTDNRAPGGIVKGSATTRSAEFSNFWKQHYEGIQRANDALSNLPKAPLSKEKLGRLTAEVKFLRAYCYYRLNMVFRGVPVYLEPIELAQCTKGAETEDTVWKTIIADLTDCISEPNFPDRYKSGDANYGRVTKAAAYALRGKVELWQKDWVKAEADFTKVGELGHKLYTENGSLSYRMLFKQANEQCDEMIFSVQNIGLDGYGTDISLYYGSRSTFGSCWNSAYPSTDFVDTYECSDGKPFNWDDFLPGYSVMTPVQRIVFFLRNKLTASEIKKFTDKGVDMSQYLPDGNEERIKKVYSKRDPRLMLSIITPYSEYFGATGTIEHTFTLRYPFRYVDDRGPYDLQTDTNTQLYYLYRKFVAEGASEIPNRAYSPLDFPLIRYADILLGLAEALNEQNDPAKMKKAIECVNLVRARSGAALLNSNSYTSVTGQEDLRERIRNGRRWEFNGEGVTFFDELRWGTWGEKKCFQGAGLKEIFGLMSSSYTYGGDQYLIWPIPAAEREMNSNLKLKDNRWID